MAVAKMGDLVPNDVSKQRVRPRQQSMADRNGQAGASTSDVGVCPFERCTVEFDKPRSCELMSRCNGDNVLVRVVVGRHINDSMDAQHNERPNESGCQWDGRSEASNPNGCPRGGTNVTQQPEADGKKPSLDSKPADRRDSERNGSDG